MPREYNVKLRRIEAIIKSQANGKALSVRRIREGLRAASMSEYAAGYLRYLDASAQENGWDTTGIKPQDVEAYFRAILVERISKKASRPRGVEVRTHGLR